jgi:hypothetical protein
MWNEPNFHELKEGTFKKQNQWDGNNKNKNIRNFYWDLNEFEECSMLWHKKAFFFRVTDTTKIHTVPSGETWILFLCDMKHM